jgi:PAS domain S-box-containing protein
MSNNKSGSDDKVNTSLNGSPNFNPGITGRREWLVIIILLAIFILFSRANFLFFHIFTGILIIFIMFMFNELSKTNAVLINEVKERKAAEEKYVASEVKLRSLFDNMHNPLLYHKAVIDDKGMVDDSIIIDLNPSFENTFCVKKDDIINKSLKKSIPSLSNEEFDLISILGLTVTSGEDTHLEYYSDDLKKWFLISVFKTSSNYAATIFNDISGQKQIEDMLCESQRFFKSTFNSLSSAIAIIDEKGMLISANKSWRQFSKRGIFFGESCNIGNNYIELCESCENSNKGAFAAAGAIKNHVLKIIRNEADELFEEYCEQAADENIYFQVSVKRFEGTGPVRLLVIYENISGRKKSENILERLNQTFLNLTSNSDKNIKLLTDICGELFETTALYNKISAGIIKTAAAYNAPPEFKLIDKAEGHICADVVARANENLDHGVCYIKYLDKTKYYTSDPNVKLYNLKTYLGKPVLCGGACIGTLCVVYSKHIDNKADSNKILEIIATALGIEEERKLSSDKLRQMSRAIEQSASTIVITDIKANIEYANPKFSRTTGYTLEEALGKNPRILKSGEMSAEDYIKMWGNLSTGLDWRGEFHNKRKNGELYWEFATISPLRNLDGEITHYLAVKEDITERKLIEIELAEAKAAAEAANMAKSEFLANMSHEIRTPMTSVMGMAELLLDTPMNDSQKKYSQHIHESANLLLTIINDILDFSKIEAGKMSIENIDMELFSVVAGVTEMMGIKALEKKLSLNTNIDDKIPPHLKGDPVRIRQILLNLLGNAVKFTKHGGIMLNMQLIKEDDTQAVVKFEVTDTGIGLSQEAKHNLFNPFVQADSSTTRNYGGTGLGLSISKRLVEMMKGEIGVISSEGEGSTFWFNLALEKGTAVSRGEKKSAAYHEGRAAETGRPAPAIDADSLALLLADDNPSNQRVLLLQLNKLGYKNIHIASDGREAVELCSKNIYSLILMDCQMNVMDGFEATRIIRAKEAGQDCHTPIIALTADAMSGTRDKCITAGMDDYITKPAGIQQLQNILNKWILKF